MNRKTCLKVKVDFEAPSKALRIYDKMREIKKINNRKEKKKTTPSSFKYKLKIKFIWFKFKSNTFVFLYLIRERERVCFRIGKVNWTQYIYTPIS